MTRFLTLRSRTSARATAAAFVALYALFASGAAFAALDLACVELKAAPCSPSPAKTEDRNCCGCSSMHADGGGCCCCASKDNSGANSALSFMSAARCANPDSGSPDGMTRISPHFADSVTSAPCSALLSTILTPETPLLSHPLSPPDTVPLAH